MANYAVVKNGVVENVIVWDGQSDLSIDGSELIEATETTRRGGSWEGNVFTFVEPDVPVEVSFKANAKSKLTALGLSEDEISAAFGI